MKPLLQDNGINMEALTASHEMLELLEGPGVPLVAILNRNKVNFHNLVLLKLVNKKRQITMTDISKKMGFSTAAATGAVDRIEKKGWVRRIDDPTDRRRTLVEITPAGREFLESLRLRLAQAIQQEAAEALAEAAQQARRVA